MRFLDEKFKKNKLKYVGQSVFGGMAVALALLFFNVVSQPVIIASFGASAFMAFTIPKRKAAGARYLIGGYIIGIIVGCLAFYISEIPVGSWTAQIFEHIAAGGIAVGLAMFLMAITNTEHPPATGIALALAINGWNPMELVKIMAGIIVISGVHRLTKSWMIDLID
jgi:CBS-domain-containing membrane protein